MRSSSFSVTLESLLAASSLLSHELEDRSRISSSQDVTLADRLATSTAQSLRDTSQRDLFCVAPLDILVSEHEGQKQFHLLELNGTGIGGITNLPQAALDAMLASLAQTASTSFNDPEGVVLLAVSGKESESNPRLNRLVHEKLLFIDALRYGLQQRFGEAVAMSLSGLAAHAQQGGRKLPTVVPGYIKDLLNAVELADDGTLWLHGRRVLGAVNDRFCLNLLQRFNHQIDLTRFQTINRCFAAGADKGIAYGLMNDYVTQHPHPALPDEVCYDHAHCREELIDIVLAWLAQGRKVVIKPHGTGLGHGIEFFFSAKESRDSIVRRIDDSLTQTAEYYGMLGGALPYTVCEYVDACRITDPSHPLADHKFELRVVVYRDGDELRAVPSIAKIAREKCDAAALAAGAIERRALINNITASGDTAKVCGTDYMLPLCNRQTMELLGLSYSDMFDLCEFATGYVRYVVDQVQDRPWRLGLPEVAATPATLAMPAGTASLARAA